MGLKIIDTPESGNRHSTSSRIRNAYRKSCCNKEGWKDYWKLNDRGQKFLKSILVIQFIAMAAYLTIDILNQTDNRIPEQTYIQYFILAVIFWLFFACFYFLWHSISYAIVVELITFAVTLVAMELYLIWRLVDEMWLAKVIGKRPGDDEFRETMVVVQQILNMVYAPCCLIIMILCLLVLPAVFEDIKDNIFLVLGGNRNLWANFYHITLSQSAVKLDFMANLEFWTTFFFVVVNFENTESEDGAKTFPLYIYWIIYGVTLLLVIIADIVGFKSIKNINKSSYCTFFITRSALEAAKIFIVVALWLDKTFLLEDLNDKVNTEFFKTDEFQRLRIYISVNCFMTLVIFAWTMSRMYKCYQTRNKTHIEQFKAMHM